MREEGRRPNPSGETTHAESKRHQGPCRVRAGVDPGMVSPMTGTYGEVVSGYGTAVGIGVVLLLLALIAVAGEAPTHRRR